ncbi:MAG: hypothetical protein II078_03235 [Muribaculaceae bacterium]|nr:hypothetical protein [Muribaculaceae bacterium]
MKKQLLILVMALSALTTNAQWNNWHTTSAISGGLGLLGSLIESSERKKAMEIWEREKKQYQATFQGVYEEAKELEKQEKWSEALDTYEEVAKLNCDYGYTDQKNISAKITSLYAKAGRTEEGPSVVNNPSVVLPDYSKYRFTLQNPISKGKKDNTQTKILRVSCSDTETRIEMECEANSPDYAIYIKPKTYITSKHSSKLRLSSVENITVAPTLTKIPWPYQKLRFALIFPALPAEDAEFDLIEPSSDWKFKDIRCQ